MAAPRCCPTSVTAAPFSRSRRTRPSARPSAPGTPPSSLASRRCRSAASRAEGICATARSRPCGASGRRLRALGGATTRRGARSALVLPHDVRGLPATRASKALVRREHKSGVHATYVFQTRYLADARGTALVRPALEQLVKAVRAAKSAAIAGGVAGGPLAQTPRGNGGEAYPTVGRVRIVDQGRRRDAERRAARLALRARCARGGRRPGLPRRRGQHAARLRSGRRGERHRRGRDALGRRRRRRVPVLAGAGGRPRAPAAALSGRLRRRSGEGPAAALAGAWVALAAIADGRAHARRADRIAGAARRPWSGPCSPTRRRTSGSARSIGSGASGTNAREWLWMRVRSARDAAGSFAFRASSGRPVNH